MENMLTKKDNYDRGKDAVLSFKASIFLILSILLTALVYYVGSLPDVLKAVGSATAVVFWFGYLLYLCQCIAIATGKTNDRFFIRSLFFVFLIVFVVHALFSFICYGFSISMTRLTIYLISLIILMPQMVILSLGISGLNSPKKNLAITNIIFSVISLAIMSYFSVLIAIYLFYAPLFLWSGMTGHPALF